MKTRFSPLSGFALLLCALLLAACGKSGGDAAGPAVKAGSNPPDLFTASAANLRNNNLGGLLEAAVPADAIAKMRAEYDQARQQPITDAERTQFAEMMTKLTARGAEDALFAEIKPQLDELRPQLPMLLGFGQAMAAQTVQQNPDLNDTQKELATQLVTGIMGWLQGADILNEDKVKRAIGVVVSTARRLELSTLDQARALSFDDMLGKANLAVGGLKELFAIYDFKIDDILDSVRAEQISSSGDQARVRVSYSLFGQNLSVETDVVRHQGRWFGRDAVENL